MPDKEFKKGLLGKLLAVLVPAMAVMFIMEAIHADILMVQAILRVFPPDSHRSSECRAWKPIYAVGPRSMMVRCASCGLTWMALLRRDGDDGQRLPSRRWKKGTGIDRTFPRVAKDIWISGGVPSQ